uniref:C-type lectin domain-containing protein n=1 Tax=Acanthochromis polyacanthus TaxID=80966 RepID=A0A3Q1EPH2_9TELE
MQSFHEAKCNFPIITGLCILPSCSAQFYHVVKAAMTWTDAQSYCREKYTDLVTINSMEDMVRLRDQLGGKDDDQFWIGLYGDLNNWKWSLEKEGKEEGQAEYSVWHPSQPNMYSGVLACTLIDTNEKWWDRKCSSSQPFICYNGKRITRNKTSTHEHLCHLSNIGSQEFPKVDARGTDPYP